MNGDDKPVFTGEDLLYGLLGPLGGTAAKKVAENPAEAATGALGPIGGPAIKGAAEAARPLAFGLTAGMLLLLALGGLYLAHEAKIL